MSNHLQIDYAAVTEKGNKEENADAADALVPEGSALTNKGIAAAICDGMSSSEGGVEAAQICVRSFMDDYLSTPDSWTVKTAATKVLGALNRWLWSQGQMRYDSAKGMVTTFTGLVIKSTTAHIFHVGDSRIYLFRDGELEQMTQDHRVWVGRDRDFLSRAMGIDAHIDIDYRTLAVEPDDIFLFTTDGVTGYVTDNRLRQILREQDGHLQASAQAIMEEALRNGSHDNVTCQLLKVLSLPQKTEDDILQKITELPFPPPMHAGVRIDNYEILRELHASSRSEVFLARDLESGHKVILKTPSENFRDDPAFLDSFLHEEWVGKRISNPHVLRVLDTPQRRFLYNIAEYVEGQSLRQWITDHPQTHINTAREYLTQIVDGLRAFHRLEMIHLDLKPENILIDKAGVLKIIDFGSTRVAGATEIKSSYAGGAPQATVDYGAPECLKGQCSNRSDIYSLGVIAYELLTGSLPYGEHDKPVQTGKLRYVPASRHNRHIQPWVDGALRKALHPDPTKRYDTLSEFLYDLSHPNPKFTHVTNQPLMERNPLAFWKGAAALLLVLNLVLLYLLIR
ncbi:MAG TPA: bifunctional protein-serine/threonine kinase/phosphatase [Thiolapillus brandeum]|uniref:Bifunctional protein-serine/threonine kinase/phosphatase n=1 Tax=Thiolapillus brandeum TaxID=1076588 RepID=A0A831RZM3_9GAMM|nr:bifunctional protein-serine/threonine kinase/phosphatase [Thiolapillus brandeum]